MMGMFMNDMTAEIENLKKRIEKLEKLMKAQEKELTITWSDSSSENKIPSKRTVLKNMDKLFSAENLRYEFCILQQERYGDRWGEWREDNFRKIGNEIFLSEESAIDSINNSIETIKECDPDLYYAICEGRKLYLYDKIKNTYKRLRKTPNGTYYLKK